MAKVIKSGQVKHKESALEKRKRRENTLKARKQAKFFAIPLLVLLFVGLAGFLFWRFGRGKELTPEAKERIRQQRQMAKIMRQFGGDYEKLKEMMEAAGLGRNEGGENANVFGSGEGADDGVSASGAAIAASVNKQVQQVEEEVAAD